ncbi:MAG: M56 family metallopeptidase [Lachnospiraceae bacterium]|nr:M56 family metallopeptidase [Lachnospiraceae bacterium]
MTGKNYYGIFTLFYEILRGNQEISCISFMSGVLWASLLILCYSWLCRRKKFKEFAGVSGMLLLYGVCIVHLFVPADTVWQKHIIIPMDSIKFPEKLRLVLSFGWPGRLWRFLVLAWILGAAVQSIRFVIGHIKTSRILDSLPKRLFADDELPEEILAILPSRTEVYRCVGISVPFSMGIIHRQILIPEREYNIQELKHIIRHESAHLKQLDHVTALLTDILCAVYWWNPCVYQLKRDIEQGLEIRCDREAVRGMENTEMAEYMTTLLSVFRGRYGTGTQKGLGMLGSGNRMRRELRERFYILEQEHDKTKNRGKERIILAGFAIFMMLLANNIVISPYFKPIHDGKGIPEEFKPYDLPLYSVTEDSYIVHTNDGKYILMDPLGDAEIDEHLANALMGEGVSYVEAAD